MIATDHNGDGDYLDPGEFLGFDEDGDRYPELAFPAGADLTRLELRITPVTDLGQQELSVSVATKDGAGEFTVLAENLLSVD